MWSAGLVGENPGEHGNNKHDDGHTAYVLSSGRQNHGGSLDHGALSALVLPPGELAATI